MIYNLNTKTSCSGFLLLPRSVIAPTGELNQIKQTCKIYSQVENDQIKNLPNVLFGFVGTSQRRLNQIKVYPTIKNKSIKKTLFI